jgi:hypothetical protein
MSLGWNAMEYCEGSGVLRHVDACPCDECDPLAASRGKEPEEQEREKQEIGTLRSVVKPDSVKGASE